jgi:hypothetical protein
LITRFENTGGSPAKNAIIFTMLDTSLIYISASKGANYDTLFHCIDWNLGEVPPQYAGSLRITAKAKWGLPMGLKIANPTSIIDITGLVSSESELASEVMPAESFAKPQNLFLNGINLKIGDPIRTNGWMKYQEFAKSIDASWFPLYYTGNTLLDALAVEAATPADHDRSQLIESGYNGLANLAITNSYYNTIFAYSGGTRTALTAIRLYNLRCERLVLISPMSGIQNWGAYKSELEEINKSGYVKEIIIYQSAADRIPMGNLYQAKFDETAENGKELKRW